MPTAQPFDLCLHCHFSQHFPDFRIFDKRLAVAIGILTILNCFFKVSLGSSGIYGACPLIFEGLHGVIETAMEFTQQGIFVNLDVIKEYLNGKHSHGHQRTIRYTGSMCRNEEDAKPSVLGYYVLCFYQGIEIVCGTLRGNKSLLSIKDKIVAVLHCPELHVGLVGAGVRLGKSLVPYQLALGYFRQEFYPLFLRAKRVNRRAAYT